MARAGGPDPPADPCGVGCGGGGWGVGWLGWSSRPAHRAVNHVRKVGGHPGWVACQPADHWDALPHWSGSDCGEGLTNGTPTRETAIGQRTAPAAKRGPVRGGFPVRPSHGDRGDHVPQRQPAPGAVRGRADGGGGPGYEVSVGSVRGERDFGHFLKPLKKKKSGDSHRAFYPGEEGGSTPPPPPVPPSPSPPSHLIPWGGLPDAEQRRPV